MTITRVGTNEKYAEGWSAVFGATKSKSSASAKAKKATPKKAATKSSSTSPAAKKAVKKKPVKKKSVKKKEERIEYIVRVDLVNIRVYKIRSNG